MNILGQGLEKRVVVVFELPDFITVLQVLGRRHAGSWLSSTRTRTFDGGSFKRSYALRQRPKPPPLGTPYSDSGLGAVLV